MGNVDNNNMARQCDLGKRNKEMGKTTDRSVSSSKTKNKTKKKNKKKEEEERIPIICPLFNRLPWGKLGFK